MIVKELYIINYSYSFRVQSLLFFTHEECKTVECESIRFVCVFCTLIYIHIYYYSKLYYMHNITILILFKRTNLYYLYRFLKSSVVLLFLFEIKLEDLTFFYVFHVILNAFFGLTPSIIFFKLKFHLFFMSSNSFCFAFS